MERFPRVYKFSKFRNQQDYRTQKSKKWPVLYAQFEQKLIFTVFVSIKDSFPCV